MMEQAEFERWKEDEVTKALFVHLRRKHDDAVQTLLEKDFKDLQKVGHAQGVAASVIELEELTAEDLNDRSIEEIKHGIRGKD